MRILAVEDEHRIANSIKKGLEQEHCVLDVCYIESEKDKGSAFVVKFPSA